MSPSLCVPKLTGADVELGNFIEGGSSRASTATESSQDILAEIRRTYGGDAGADDALEGPQDDPQDRGRTFFRSNGGCAYIDLDHLELCIPEVLSAHDHVAWWHAMLRIASNAQASLNARRSPNEKVQLLANNSDGRVSYGSHLNVLVSRAAWDNIVHRKPHYLAWLAAFQVSSLPLTGAGKVGGENGTPLVPFQLSQRADHFESVTGMQTTYMRPLVNTRDEPLCGHSVGSPATYARFHSIFFDSTLTHASTFLRVGMMQIALAMVEAGRIDSRIALEDALVAVRQYSQDPLLEAKATLISGQQVTAIELQRRFFDQAVAFVESGAALGIVADAPQILALWDNTLGEFEARNWPMLARRLDWMLKLSFLERAFEQRPSLTWTSPEIKHLDFLYASLDHAAGLYWNVADRGLIETLVSDARIAECVREPPADTRAWGRAVLLRRAGSAVEHVDWDHMRVRLRESRDRNSTWRVDFPDPLRSNRADIAHLMRTNPSMQELLESLGASQVAQVVPSDGVSAYAAVNWPLVLDNGNTVGPAVHGPLPQVNQSKRKPHFGDTDGTS